jgi:hypothetical protein
MNKKIILIIALMIILLPFIYMFYGLPFIAKADLVITSIQDEVDISPEGASQIFSGFIHNKGTKAAKNTDVFVRWNDGMSTHEKSVHIGIIPPGVTKSFEIIFKVHESRWIAWYSQWVEFE